MRILEGQRVLITGAGSGIGKVMAEHFEKSGARIWICDNDEKILNQILQENPKWQGNQCDVSNEDSVNQLFEASPRLQPRPRAQLSLPCGI